MIRRVLGALLPTSDFACVQRGLPGCRDSVGHQSQLIHNALISNVTFYIVVDKITEGLFVQN